MTHTVEPPPGYMEFPYPGSRFGTFQPIEEVERVAKKNIRELGRMTDKNWKFDPTYHKIKLRRVED